MRRDREYYTDSDNPDVVLWGMTWRAIGVGLLVLLLCGGLGWGAWAIKVATSGIKGAGDAKIQINSGKNRIQSQELFEALYAKIQEYDRNLDSEAAALAANPTSEFAQTNYKGLVQICNAAVTQYNAEARKISTSPWKSDDLPWQIDQTNPAFDCKESGAK